MHKLIYALSIICLTVMTIGGCGSSDSTSSTVEPITVKNSSLPVATKDAVFKAILGASGGKAPYTWSIVDGAGNLPAGLTLSTDGNITGTPNAEGTYTVVFKVTDSSTPALIVQKPLQINVSTLVFTPGTVGAALYAEHCAWCHFSIGSPNQQHVGASLAQVMGAITADTGGMAEFGPGRLFPLTDVEITSIVAAMSAPVAYIPPTFTIVSLPAATVGTAYSQTLTARDGTKPYVWSTMGGDPIPAGLSLNSSTGVISGTPTAAGVAAVMFMLEDANASTMVHQSITITVNAVAAPPDGVALYTAKCATCHNALATSTKKGRTAMQIKSAITANSGGMGSLSALTDAEIQAIAAANP